MEGNHMKGAKYILTVAVIAMSSKIYTNSDDDRML